MHKFKSIQVMFFALGVGIPLARAQTYLPGYSGAELVSAGLNRPTCMEIIDENRVLIAQQGGAIRVWRAQSGLLGAPLHTFAVDSSGERGLLGMAADPEFA